MMKKKDFINGKSISAFIIAIIICVFAGFYISHLISSDIEPMGISYYCQYDINISATQHGNYTIIVPVIIYPNIPINHIEYNQSNVVLNGTLYHRMDELYLTNGNNDTQYEIINTSKGYGLQITASGNVNLRLNVSKKVYKPTRELDKLYAPSSITLSTTITDIAISPPSYWVFFSNESSIDEVQLRLSFRSRDNYHFNRTIVIHSIIAQHGWNIVSGEFILGSN